MDVQMDGELKTGWFELQLNVLPAGFWVDWCAPVLAGLFLRPVPHHFFTDASAASDLPQGQQVVPMHLVASCPFRLGFSWNLLSLAVLPALGQGLPELRVHSGGDTGAGWWRGAGGLGVP